MSAFLRLPVTQRKRPQSFGCSHWKKYRCPKRRSCVISCSFIHFLTFSVIGSMLLAFPPCTIWYFLCPVLACLVWRSPLITWRSESLELFAGQGASLLSTEPTFDRKHEERGFFLFLLEASLKGRFSLCLTCNEAFHGSQNKPWQNKPFCMQRVLQNVVFLKCANQRHKIDPALINANLKGEKQVKACLH